MAGVRKTTRVPTDTGWRSWPWSRFSSITPPSIEAPAPAAETSAPAVSVIDIDTIAPIDFSEADAQFFAELSAAAAGFNPQAMPTATAPEAVVATGADANADATTGFDAGFDDDACRALGERVAAFVVAVRGAGPGPAP